MNIAIISTISGSLLLVFSFLKYKNRNSEAKKNKNPKQKESFITSEVVYDVLIQMIIVFFSAFLAMWLSSYLEKKTTMETAQSMAKMLSQENVDRVINVYNKSGRRNAEDEGYLAPDEAMESMVSYILDHDIKEEKNLLFNDYMTSSLTPSSLMYISMTYGIIEDECRNIEDISSREDYMNDSEMQEKLVKSIASYCYYASVLSYYYDILYEVKADADILVVCMPEYSFWDSTNGKRVYGYMLDALEEKYQIDLTEYRDKTPVIKVVTQ